MSTSNSSSLLGTTISWEVSLVMNCVTSHYWQRSMNELLDLLAMIFPDSKNCKKQHWVIQIWHVINYGLKNFGEECMGLVKKVNHFTVCIGEVLSHISNFKHYNFLWWDCWWSGQSIHRIFIYGTWGCWNWCTETERNPKRS